jgi:hypothetical protein
MSDGREEREEQEWRRQQEQRRDQQEKYQDRNNSDSHDQWQPERKES